MGNEMQRVVDGYSDDDRTYSQHNQRDVAPHDRDKAHGKKPTKAYRCDNEQQAPLSPEREHQQQHNQRHGDRDGQPTVFLYLTGITHGYHRRTRDGNVNAGHRLHGLLCDAVDIIHQQVVVRRLHRTVWRRQHGNGIFLSRCEDIPVVHLERHGRLSGLQPVGQCTEKTQWVVADARGEKARGRHHHHLHIGSQLAVSKIRSCQHVLHAHVVTVGEHERHVLVEECRDIGNLVEIHLCRYLADMSFPFVAHDFRGKRVNSFLLLVGQFPTLFLCLEHRIDALSAGHVLIHRDGALLVSAQRKEVVDILIVFQRGDHCYQNRCQHCRQRQAKTSPLLQEVIDV